jgi:hypothetical protein
MTAKKQSKGRKVTVVLSSCSINKIDKELRKLRKEDPHKKPTRASICTPIIENGILKFSITEKEKSEACSSLLEQSKEFKKKAASHADAGENNESSSAYLMAAAKELEALAILNTNDENMIRSTIIQTIQLIKRGTGYNHLPNVPVNRQYANKFH